MRGQIFQERRVINSAPLRALTYGRRPQSLMSSNRLFLSTLLIFSSLALSACGSGGESGSQPTAVSPSALNPNSVGLFSGELVSGSGVNKGVLNLQTSSDGSTSSLSLSGAVEAEISEILVSGSTLEKEIPVPGLTAGVLLKANFSNEAWSGTLSVPSSSTVYNFVLAKSVEAKLTSESPRLAPEGLYSGRFTYESGGKRAAKIQVVATTDLGERLLALFTPQSAASVQLVYDGGSKESVTDAVWNSEQRTLIATGPAMTSLGAPQLQCVFDELENLDCVLAMGKKSTAKGKFVRETPRVAPKPKPTPKPTPKPSVPTQSPSPVVPQATAPAPMATPVPPPAPQVSTPKNFGTERTFYGKASFANAGKSKAQSISLTVTLLATGVQGPVASRVAFRAFASQVGADFRMSVYDSIEKTLKGEQRLSTGALAGSLILTCRDFDFSASPYSFTCDYESTTTGVSGSFVMSGK